MELKECLYNLIIEGKELTTSNLIDAGFSHHYITKFVKNNILERVMQGVYKLKDYNEIFNYGNHLLSMNDLDNAEKCFLIYLGINPEHSASYYQLLNVSIKSKNYIDSIKYIDILSDKKIILEDERKYLLFLLSQVTTLSYLHSLEIEYLNFYDIRVSDDNIENKIRSFCLKDNFSYALTLQKQKNVVNSSFIDSIHMALLNNIFQDKKEINAVVNNMINEEKYEELLNYLNEQKGLSKLNQYIKKVLKVLLELEQAETLPNVTSANALNVFEAIDANNFSLAYMLNNSYCKNAQISNNSLNILLAKVCDLIKEITSPNPRKNNRIALNYLTYITDDNLGAVENYIARVHKLLSKKGGVILLEPLNEETTLNMLDLINLCSNLEAFLINFEDQDRIVIKYTSKDLSADEKKRLKLYGKYAYEYKQYDDCMNKYLRLLQSDTNDWQIYSTLGFVYYKVGKYQEAIKYLIIAMDLSKKANCYCDYSEFILKLKGVYSKPTFKMDEEEFYDNEGQLLRKIDK